MTICICIYMHTNNKNMGMTWLEPLKWLKQFWFVFVLCLKLYFLLETQCTIRLFSHFSWKAKLVYQSYGSKEELPPLVDGSVVRACSSRLHPHFHGNSNHVVSIVWIFQAVIVWAVGLTHSSIQPVYKWRQTEHCQRMPVKMLCGVINGNHSL